MRRKWVEHLLNAWEAFLDDVFSFVPEESRKHLKNAKKEVLLAIKSAIEKKIEELEKDKREVKKIKVEKAE